MAYIPDDAEWYLADLVIEMRIMGERRNVVHVNTVLVHARSPAQAYREAIKLGRGEEHTYQNTDHQTVRVLFRGLAHLDVIHEPLEHGSELTFSQKIGVSERRLRQMVLEKTQLAAFRDVEPMTGPNYVPKMIMDRLAAEFERREKRRLSARRRRAGRPRIRR